MTLRAVEKNNADGQMGIALDAVESQDYRFATGEYEGRDITVTPQLIPLDLKLPKINGPEVLGRCGTTSERGSYPWSS